MNKSIFVLATVFTLVLGSTAHSKCFHGWISQKGNAYPTGYCTEINPTGSFRADSSIEIDYPTQQLFIHGILRSADGKLLKWLSRFAVTSCTDTAEGWTVVHGLYQATGEKYELKYRETGAVHGVAELTVEHEGQTHQAQLSCLRDTP